MNESLPLTTVKIDPNRSLIAQSIRHDHVQHNKKVQGACAIWVHSNA